MMKFTRFPLVAFVLVICLGAVTQLDVIVDVVRTSTASLVAPSNKTTNETINETTISTIISTTRASEWEKANSLTTENTRSRDDYHVSPMRTNLPSSGERTDRIPRSPEAIGGEEAGKKTNQQNDEDNNESDNDEKGRICELAVKDFRSASGMFCIVTGTEESGVHPLGNLIMSAPGVYGGYEGGMLLASHPANFVSIQPFFDWVTHRDCTHGSKEGMVEKNRTDETNCGWGLSIEQRGSLLNSSCHAEMYRRLHEYSPLFGPSVHQEIQIVDRTPRYVEHLRSIMDLTPRVPVVVSVMTDDEQIWRQTGRTGASMRKKLQRGKASLEEAQKVYPGRIMVVEHKSLMEEPNLVMKRVYDFLGLEWNPDYLSMEALNAKASLVGGPVVPPFGSDVDMTNPVVDGDEKGSSIVVEGKEDDEPPPIPEYPHEFPEDLCNVSRTDFRAASGLYCIITGMEHSGTTMMSKLIMSAPNMYGAFEGGLLLASTPEEFKDHEPFFHWMTGEEWFGWKLTEAQRQTLLEASCHAEMYVRLRQHSPMFGPPNDQSWVVDKTPSYIRELVDVMDRSPGIPVVVMQKMKEEQVLAYQKRGHNETDISDLMRLAVHMLKAAQKKYPNRILIVNSKEWGDNPDLVMERVYDFVGLRHQWKSEYLLLEAYNAKGKHLNLNEKPGFMKNRTDSIVGGVNETKTTR